MPSFAFMFELVPDPVWKTSIGNWSSSSPAATRSAAAAMRSESSASRSPRSALTRAAAALIRPSQWATGAGIGSPETGKLETALSVSPPQSCRFSVALTSLSVDAVLRPHARRNHTQPQPRRAPRGHGNFAQRAAELLAHGLRRRPTDVAAARALTGVSSDEPLQSAGEALDAMGHRPWNVGN